MKHHALPHYYCHSTLNLIRCLNHSILHHFNLVEQLLPFPCEMEENMLYLKVGIMPEIKTPSFTTLSLSLNSESDKMLESFNSSLLSSGGAAVAFFLWNGTKICLYLKVGIMPEIKGRILSILFIFSLFIYMGGERKTKISTIYESKWLIFTYHWPYCMKRKLWLVQPSILQTIFVQSLFKTDLHSEQ